MRSSEDFVKDFMSSLKSGKFEKHQENQGPELSEEFVKREVNKFDEFMKLDIFRETLMGGGHILHTF